MLEIKKTDTAGQINNSDKIRILVVDDDETLASTMKEILEISGYLAEAAFSGEEAKKKILDGYFSMALLDMRLPDTSGIELLKWVKKETPRTIVMMITGYPSLDNAVESLNFGANAYIMKPINAKEFLTFIAAKFKEQNEKEMGVLEQFLPSYLDAINDGNLWSVNTISQKLSVPQIVVERTSNFCASVGLIKYWKNKGIVQKLDTERKIAIKAV
jgi:DNA-binding response OmpR family regulator